MLKETRNKKGLSQSQLAKLSGVSIRTIQSYEKLKFNRDIDNARLSTLIDFAVALDCPIRDLLNDEELKKKCETTKL